MDTKKMMTTEKLVTRLVLFFSSTLLFLVNPMTAGIAENGLQTTRREM
jgi:hypothetical protein